MSHPESKFRSLARMRYISVMSTIPTCSAKGTEVEERIEKGEEEEDQRRKNGYWALTFVDCLAEVLCCLTPPCVTLPSSIGEGEGRRYFVFQVLTLDSMCCRSLALPSAPTSSYCHCRRLKSINKSITLVVEAMYATRKVYCSCPQWLWKQASVSSYQAGHQAEQNFLPGPTGTKLN